MMFNPKLGDEYRPTGDQHNYRICPVCGDDNWHFYLNPVKGAWDCKKCSAAGYMTGQDRTVTMVERALVQQTAETQWTETQLPPWKPLGETAREYLQGRRMLGSASRYGLVEHETEPRIVIPYFSSVGDLIYWNSRAYLDGVEPRYKTKGGRHPLYIPARGLNESNQAVIVEGCFDAMAVANAGYFVVALGGKSLPAHLRPHLFRELNRYESVTILFDDDALSEAVKLLGVVSPMVIPPVGVEICEVAGDPAEMSRTTLRRLLK